MIEKYNKMSLAIGLPGLFLQLIGQIIRDNTSSIVGSFMMLIGTIAFIVGLDYYAKAKGRSDWWCLMAFLSLIGFIVLACLKDKSIRR